MLSKSAKINRHNRTITIESVTMSKGTILFVDDELSVLKSLKRIFQNEDCHVLTANGGEEALEILKTQAVHLVVSDQRMPKMSGANFLEKVRESYPNIIRITMSGYADIAAVIESINKAHIRYFLPKPWDNDEMKIVLLRYLGMACGTVKEAYLDQEYCRSLQAIIFEQQREIMRMKSQLNH